MAIRHAGSRSYYEHKYKAFGNQVLRAPFMQGEMGIRAEKVKAAAIAISPEETGEYKGSFEVSVGIRTTGKRRTRRAYGRVTNTSSHALAVEFGWDKTPRYRVLGKALGVVPGDQVAGA